VREGDGVSICVDGRGWMVAEEREGEVEDAFSKGDLGRRWGVEGTEIGDFGRSAGCCRGSDATDAVKCVGGGEKLGEDQAGTLAIEGAETNGADS
jgi:hypothetical protein